MSFKTFKQNLARGFSRTMLKARKVAPDIMVLGGIVGLVAAGVMACKATKKAEEEIETAKKGLDDIEEYYDDDSLTAAEQSARLQEIVIVKGEAAVNLAKIYGPSILLGALSTFMVLKSHGILKKRNAALGAAYAAVDGAFKRYRKRVTEELGKDADRKFRIGGKKENITYKTTDESGKDVEVTKEETVLSNDDLPGGYSQYAVIFDSSNTNWKNSPYHNKNFILQAQKHADDRLKARGHLFLNEVYEMLGFPHTSAGAVVGWVRGNGDGYVDFGLMDFYSNANRLFHEGFEPNIWLDFNVDGVIWDKI